MSRAKAQDWTRPGPETLDVTELLPAVDGIRAKYVGDLGSPEKNEALVNKLGKILGNMRLLQASRLKPSEASMAKGLSKIEASLSETLAALDTLDDRSKSLLIAVAGQQNLSSGLSFPLPERAFNVGPVLTNEGDVVVPHRGEASVETATIAMIALRTWLQTARAELDTRPGRTPKKKTEVHYGLDAVRNCLAGASASARVEDVEHALRLLVDPAAKRAPGIVKQRLG